MIILFYIQSSCQKYIVIILSNQNDKTNGVRVCRSGLRKNYQMALASDNAFILFYLNTLYGIQLFAQPRLCGTS